MRLSPCSDFLPFALVLSPCASSASGECGQQLCGVLSVDVPGVFLHADADRQPVQLPGARTLLWFRSLSMMPSVRQAKSEDRHNKPAYFRIFLCSTARFRDTFPRRQGCVRGLGTLPRLKCMGTTGFFLAIIGIIPRGVAVPLSNQSACARSKPRKCGAFLPSCCIANCNPTL